MTKAKKMGAALGAFLALAMAWTQQASAAVSATPMAHEDLLVSFTANLSVKILRISGYAPTSNWLGTASGDNPRPSSSCVKNCGSIEPTAMYPPSAVS